MRSDRGVQTVDWIGMEGISPIIIIIIMLVFRFVKDVVIHIDKMIIAIPG